MSRDCDDFVRDEYGRIALGMTTNEILKVDKSQTKGVGFSPVLKAHLAFDRLADSDLLFDRSVIPSPSLFDKIAASCDQLDRDLDDPSKLSARRWGANSR